jgi:hypothetical protein
MPVPALLGVPAAAALMQSRFAPALWNMAGRGITGLGNMIKGRGFRGAEPYKNKLLNPSKVYTGPTSRTGQFVNKHPYWTMAGAGTAGGIGYGLLSDGNEDAIGDPSGGAYPPGAGGVVPQSIPDNFVPNMMPRSEYLRETSQKDIKQLSKIKLRSQIIKTAGGDPKQYEESRLGVMIANIKARGDIRQAEILEGSLNKDGSIPVDSKVWFDRLIKQGADPVYASELSGYQLAIEKTQAENYKAMMTGKLTAKDAARSDVQLMQSRGLYTYGNPAQKEQAIEKIVMMLHSGEIPIEDKVTGFGQITGEQYRDLAIAILSGTVMPAEGGASNEPTEEDVDIFGISAD